MKVKAIPNVIKISYTQLIYIVVYNICLYYQVSDLIIQKNLIRACFKKVVGVMENSVLLIDCPVLSHNDDWLKDNLWVWQKKGFNSVLLTMNRNKYVINSEQILRTITSQRGPENKNQVKLQKICYRRVTAPDYYPIEKHALNDTGNISAYKIVQYFLMKNHIM